MADNSLSATITALKVIRTCLRGDTGDIGGYHDARQWLRDHDRYEGNLQELAVPLEVAEVALRIVEANEGVAALSVGEPATINTPEIDDRPLGPLNVCTVCGTEWDAGDSCPTCPEQCCCLQFWTLHHPDCPAKSAGAPAEKTATPEGK
jgi:hypothetical protein